MTLMSGNDDLDGACGVHMMNTTVVMAMFETDFLARSYASTLRARSSATRAQAFAGSTPPLSSAITCVMTSRYLEHDRCVSVAMKNRVGPRL